jgi:ribosomal protein S27AE
MAGSGKTLGILLMAGGLLIAIVAIAWLGAGLADDEGGLRLSGAVFGGALIVAFVVLPMVAGGFFIYSRGKSESAQFAHVQRQRRMLGIVESAGQVNISDLALELGGSRDTVRTDLYDLVSKGLFAGYVDWDRGVLYARQASELRGRETCPNCGGNVSLAGKGLVRCQYCGAEIFLP